MNFRKLNAAVCNVNCMNFKMLRQIFPFNPIVRRLLNRNEFKLLVYTHKIFVQLFFSFYSPFLSFFLWKFVFVCANGVSITQFTFIFAKFQFCADVTSNKITFNNIYFIWRIINYYTNTKVMFNNLLRNWKFHHFYFTPSTPRQLNEFPLLTIAPPSLL